MHVRIAVEKKDRLFCFYLFNNLSMRVDDELFIVSNNGFAFKTI